MLSRHAFKHPWHFEWLDSYSTAISQQHEELDIKPSDVKAHLLRLLRPRFPGLDDMFRIAHP
eukprot:3739789-Karenia_brevis.AAC.1